VTYTARYTEALRNEARLENELLEAQRETMEAWAAEVGE
jgi:hypothetical protein